MPLSSITPSKTNALLALICLCILRRLRPDWVCVSVREAAQAEDQSAERISRLTTHARGLFLAVVGKLTRIGRPQKEQADSLDCELAITRSLLDVATSILKHVNLRKAATRALIVGAYLKTREAHPTLTQKRFCATLSLSQRTLRSWLEKPVTSDMRARAVNNDEPPPARKRPLRRGRFAFSVTLPDTQYAADTTDIRAFGIFLKLIAAQDIGGRDQSLLDSVIVSDHESADLVVAVLEKALTDRPGAQLLSDQGTPYLAAKTREAIEQLDVEHAIQKEGEPTGKATVERAFGTVKRIASPFLELTEQVARAVPCLAQPELAIAVTTLFITALLRAYQAGARASDRASLERTGDVTQLKRAAEDSRERARADMRSARLLLTRIHDAFGLGEPLQGFIRRFRYLPVTVLQAAERAFGLQAHRTDIKNRSRYFSAIVFSLLDDYSQKQARARRQREHDKQLARHTRQVKDERARQHDNPDTWLRDILDLLALRWNGTELFLGDLGLSTWLRQALTRLTELHGPHAQNVIIGVFHDFERKHLPDLGPAGITAVKAVLHRHLGTAKTPRQTPSSAAHFAATLRATGSISRPSPSRDPC